MYYISFSLAVNSGSLLLNSSELSREKVCLRVYWQRDLQPQSIWPAKGNISIFTSAQLFTVSCTVQWTCHLWNSFCVSTVICDTNSDEFVEDTESDEEEDDFNDEEQLSPSLQHQIMKWWLQSRANQTHIPQFTGADKNKKQNETLHIKKIQHLWAFSCCILYLLLICWWQRLTGYYHQYLDRYDKTPNPFPDETNSKTFLFVVVIVQMGHNIHDRLRDYWTRTEQFFTPFYPTTVTPDCFLLILHYLHFTNNDKEIDKNVEN